MAYLLNEDKAKGDCVSFEAHKDLQRGMFLEIVGRKETTLLGVADFELYEVKDASATTLRNNLLVNIAVAKQYDERLMEQDFVLKSTEAGRGRFPIAGCKHTIAKELATGVLVEGNLLKLGAGVLVKIGTGEEALAVAVIEEVLNWKGQDSYRIRYI